MKAFRFPFPAQLFAFVVALAALMVSGCASTKNVDWASRVGTFTYDQAIGELGPPDKQAKLSDGKTVATWITGRSPGMSVGVGVGSYGGYSGVGVGQSVHSSGRDHTLQLTFDADGKLMEWAKK